MREAENYCNRKNSEIFKKKEGRIHQEKRIFAYNGKKGNREEHEKIPIT